MKQIRGMWFPDGDRHFEAQLAHGPVIDGRGTYQFRKYAAALPHVPERGLALDIGAHVGLWTRVMALDFARVVAFEPLPAHVACFERNLAGAANVELKPIALGEKAGKLSLAPVADNSGNAHVADEGGVAAEIRKLDSFRLRDIDLIKIDVEGYEVAVLKGAEATIRRECPAIIIEQKPNGSAERYGHRRFAALDMLRGWGGVVAWEIGGDFLVTFPGCSVQGPALCVTPERREKTQRIMMALRGSLGGTLLHGSEPRPGQPFAVWGHLWTGLRLVPKAMAAGTPFWFVDNGWWMPARGGPTGFYAVTYRSLMPMLLEQPDMGRLPVAMAPWRDPSASSGPVLLCMPGPAFGQMFGWDMNVWARAVIAEIRRHTRRDIVVRDKASTRPFAADLAEAAVVVTHSSKAAVEAIVAGVPAIVEPGSAAAPVGGTDLAQVERPPMPDRRKWWASLMCQQFTLAELRNGVARRLLEAARKQGEREREIKAGVPAMSGLLA